MILAELLYLQDLLSPKSIDFSETFIQKPVVFSSQKCFDDISTRWNKQTPHRSFTLHQRMISKQWQCNIIQNNSKIWNKYSVRVWIKRHDIYIAYMYYLHYYYYPTSLTLEVNPFCFQLVFPKKKTSRLCTTCKPWFGRESFPGWQGWHRNRPHTPPKMNECSLEKGASLRKEMNHQTKPSIFRGRISSPTFIP